MRPLYKSLFTLLLFFFAIGFLSNSAQAQLNVKKHTLSAKKFERKSKKENAVLLDVRTEKEFAEGHLPGATLMDVQKEDFATKLAGLDKNKTYLVYCRSGRRSQKAIEQMHEAGFRNVYHLKGGYLDWKGATTQ